MGGIPHWFAISGEIRSPSLGSAHIKVFQDKSLYPQINIAIEIRYTSGYRYSKNRYSFPSAEKPSGNPEKPSGKSIFNR
jgi:hypothetical protein